MRQRQGSREVYKLRDTSSARDGVGEIGWGCLSQMCVGGLRHFGGPHPLEGQEGVPALSGPHFPDDLDLNSLLALSFVFKNLFYFILF